MNVTAFLHNGCKYHHKMQESPSSSYKSVTTLWHIWRKYQHDLPQEAFGAIADVTTMLHNGCKYHHTNARIIFFIIQECDHFVADLA